jgi:uncharacterized RDD family membrane protein YckC
MDLVKPRLNIFMRIPPAVIDLLICAGVFSKMEMTDSVLRAVAIYEKGFTPFYDFPRLFPDIALECYGLAPGFGLMLALLFLPELLLAATPGMLIFGQRVKNEDDEPATYGQLFFRALVKHSFVIALLIALAVRTSAPVPEIPGGILAIGFVCQVAVLIGVVLAAGKNRQALHDRFTRTAIFSGWKEGNDYRY